MKRAKWPLPITVLVFALLLALPSLAAADAGAAAPATAVSLAAAPGQGIPVVDKAAAAIPDANHYKCYPIREHSDFQPRIVLLRDQFWETKVWVWRPRYLCNPVWKTTEDGTTYEPPQPDAHLVCYEIREENPTPRWEVKTDDQFGTLKLIGDAAELLCLPAAKHVVIPPGG
jgi:hypothetical protein